jgi:hypothetical protein
VLDLADRELTDARLASAIVRARLGYILFVRHFEPIVRAFGRAKDRGCGATLDPNIAAVLRAIHAKPSEGWTLTVLAGKAAMSRSCLASRFRELVGIPGSHHPAAHGARHGDAGGPRAHHRGDRIRHGLSVAWFHHAFCREIWTAPGEFRAKLKQAAGAATARQNA